MVLKVLFEHRRKQGLYKTRQHVYEVVGKPKSCFYMFEVVSKAALYWGPVLFVHGLGLIQTCPFRHKELISLASEKSPELLSPQ